MTHSSIRLIWCEFEANNEPYNELDCNSDVIFQLDDNSKWAATFFTYKNIESLQKKNQLSGECLNGRYFCAKDMILISRMSREIILMVLEEILSHDEIEIYCSKI